MFTVVDIDSVWHLVEPTAGKLLKRPRVIRNACRKGEAVCLQCEDGVVVITVDIEPVNHTRELRVWWAGVTRQASGCFEKYLPHVLKIASDLKCSAIAFGSNRRGWTRKAMRFGFIIRSDNGAIVEFARSIP
jgi:hypothetical protein